MNGRPLLKDCVSHVSFGWLPVQDKNLMLKGG